jgi:2-dehydropantoate 2-reductase
VTRFVIFGAGAIGSGMGGHLHRTGHDALLVGRPTHVERIRDRGLELITADETFTLRVPAVTSAEEVRFSPDDVLLLCVKSQDTDTALQQIRAAGADPRQMAVLCCQNSITNEPAAARYFRRVYGVLVVVPGVFLQPGVVYNNSQDNAGLVEVGRFPAGSDELCEHVASALLRASYAASANPRVMAAKGGKVFSNLANALGAITDALDGSEAFMTRVRQEAQACFVAAGIPFEQPDAFQARAARIHRQSTLPPGVRNLGSTWQSLQRGANSTEVDFLNGEIVRLGRVHGIPTPCNEVLQEVASLMAARGEKPGTYSVADLERFASSRD